MRLVVLLISYSGGFRIHPLYNTDHSLIEFDVSLNDLQQAQDSGGRYIFALEFGREVFDVAILLLD